MKKIIITGGTGFIGLSLADQLLENGYTPILIARKQPKIKPKHKLVLWDGFSLGEWKEELNNAHAIVNLAGKTVDCVKTPDNCDLILRSRVDSTNVIGKALKSISNPPRIWVQMATAHIYGDPPNRVCSESDAYGFGLAPIVGEAWEEAF